MQSIANYDATGPAALVPMILDSGLKGLVFLSLIALTILFMRHASASARHWIWFLGLAGVLVLPFLSAALPEWRALSLWPNAPFSAGATPPPPLATSVPPGAAAMAPSSEAPKATLSASEITTHSTTSSASNPAGSPTKSWAWWIGATAAAIAGLLFLRLLGCLLNVHIATLRARPVPNGPLFESLLKAQSQLGVSRNVRLRLDERRIVPIVWGLFRPCLVLPAEASNWDQPRLRSVLLHELAHVRRHDVLVMLTAQLACVLHWFNPLVWLAAWRLHLERERACDDLVINTGVKASDYAEHLLHAAAKLQGNGFPGAVAMASPSRFEGRLIAVLDERANRRGITRRSAAAAALLGASIIVPVAMLHAAEKENAVVFTESPAVLAAAEEKPQPPQFSTLPQTPWTVHGRVIDPDGQPLPNAEIRVHTGIGTLRQTGTAITDADGRYALSFGRGIFAPVDTPNLQYAIVTAHKPGYFENNLNRHGARAAALRAVSAEDRKTFGVEEDQLFLPGQPQVINFAMAPAARVHGRFLGTGDFSRLSLSNLTREERKKASGLPSGYVRVQQSPLPRWRIWLVGEQLPPASSVLASAETDAEGNFAFENVPVGFEWHFQTERSGEGPEPNSPTFKLRRPEDAKFHLELLQHQNTLRFIPDETLPDGADTQTAPADPAAQAERSASVLSLFEQEIELAERQLALARQGHEAAHVSLAELLSAERELLSLKRTKAAHENDSSEVLALFSKELELLEKLDRGARQNLENGVGTTSALLRLQREQLALERQRLEYQQAQEP